MPSRSDKSLARSLGEFFGHIYKGITADTSEHKKRVNRRTETETRETPRGKVTIRRTIIEEVDLDTEHLKRDPENEGDTP